MKGFLPPETVEIFDRIARRNAARAREALSRLGPAVAGQGPEPREALAALESVLASLRGDRRREFLVTPGFRGWLAFAEEVALMLDPPASDLALFNRISRGEHLADLLPSGRVDRGFRKRVDRLGRRLLEQLMSDLPWHLAGFTPRRSRFGPFRCRVEASPEEARAAGERYLFHPSPMRLVARRGFRFDLSWSPRAPGSSPRPQGREAGERARRAALTGIAVRPEAAIRWAPLPLIPGTAIPLLRRVRATRAGLRVGSVVKGLADRIGEAFALAESAWPEAAEEVRRHTRAVIPLDAPGTVSYSVPGRPGISYINVFGKSVVQLADDLIHETAHHRLHCIEEIEGDLDLDDGEPRYRSPWREAIRPVRGILHAAYTFTYRAELLRRLLERPRSRSLPGRLRSWLRKELDREREMLAASARDLRDARRRGLLTPPGKKISSAISSVHPGTL